MDLKITTEFKVGLTVIIATLILIFGIIWGKGFQLKIFGQISDKGLPPLRPYDTGTDRIPLQKSFIHPHTATLPYSAVHIEP